MTTERNVPMRSFENGLTIPCIGFGTADLPDDVERIVSDALRAGYRLIDTAAVYGSESGVGAAVEKAIAEGLVKREELFLQTKLAPDRHGYHEALDAFEESLEQLRTEYVDMYMIHWPVARGSEDDYPEKNIAVWQAFEELQRKGRIKHLGVCNFLERHILQLTEAGMSVPEVNQLEVHPAFQQRGLVRFCREHKIAVEAWAPMGRGVLKTPEFEQMARAYNKNVGQLALRWNLQNGTLPVVRSSSLEHMQNNLDLFDFELLPEDMQRLNELNTCDMHQDFWSYKRQQMY